MGECRIETPYAPIWMLFHADGAVTVECQHAEPHEITMPFPLSAS